MSEKKTTIYVLGVHIGHDRCSAIVKNGKVIAAIAEERLDRNKYSKGDYLPSLSMDYVFKISNISHSELSMVVITHSGCEINKNIEISWKREVDELFFPSKIQVVIIGHHEAHAYSAFYTSPFDKAAVFVADGGGDIPKPNLYEAESYYIGDSDGIREKHKRFQDTTIKYGTSLAVNRYDYMNIENENCQISLGFKFQQITYLIGFGFGQAGKTMGLAPFGKPFIELKSKVNNLNVDLKYKDYIDELHHYYLKSGKSYTKFIMENRANIAYDIQSYLNRTTLSLVKNLRYLTKEENLCLAGGVFLNSVANYKILKNSGFKKVYIVPPAGDDGQAIGAALYGYKKINTSIKPVNYFSPCLGKKFTQQEIQKALSDFNLKSKIYTEQTLLAKTIARALFRGKTIGVIQGRSETGPRALGNRSILVSPLIPWMKDHINHNIKYREDFRPFAPIVIEEKTAKYFDIDVSSPYMLLVTQVLKKYNTDLVGITHVDGSARIQTINKKQNRLIYMILIEFEKLSGFPILINTSFNTKGEPIVDSPRDAILTFRQTALDYLLLENYLIE